MISIIVPIYNTEKYLNACIESLTGQSVQELQLILVDDESTDGSLLIAQTYAAKDPRIEVYARPHAGQSAARNYGLTKAKGEFIAFVDADDRIEKDWCETHLSAITGVDYVQSGYRRVIDDAPKKAILPHHRYQFTSPCMRLYRREMLTHLHFPEGYIYEDVLFSADIWRSGAHCRMIPYAGYLYSYNPKSTTAEPHPEAQQRVLNALREKAKNASPKAKLILYYTCVKLSLYFKVSGSRGSDR